MKKSVLALSTGALLLGAASNAQAHNCKSIACLNREVNALQKQVKTERLMLSTVSDAFTCLNEIPVTQYGATDATYGFQWNNADGTSFSTTALDVTTSGDNVGAWVLTDACNTSINTNTVYAKSTRSFVRISRRAFVPFWGKIW